MVEEDLLQYVEKGKGYYRITDLGVEYLSDDSGKHGGWVSDEELLICTLTELQPLSVALLAEYVLVDSSTYDLEVKFFLDGRSVANRTAIVSVGWGYNNIRDSWK